MVASKVDVEGKKADRSLVALLGLDGKTMRWEALLVLLLAGWLAGAFMRLATAVLYGGDLVSLWPWLMLAAHSALQAVFLGMSLRLFKRDLRAGAIAAVFVGMGWPVVMGLIQFGGVFFGLWFIVSQFSACFMLVAGMVLGIKLFKADGPALVLGAAAGRAMDMVLMSLVGNVGLMGYGDPLWMEMAGQGALYGFGSAALLKVLAAGLFGGVLWGAGKVLPVAEQA